MQPRITEGNFSLKRCNAKQRYQTLQFLTFDDDNIDHDETKCSSVGGGYLSSLLSQNAGVDLGPVEEDWFSKRRKDGQESGASLGDRGKMVATTPHHITISKNYPSPSLFSPEQEPSSIPQQYRKLRARGHQEVRSHQGESQSTPLGFPFTTQGYSISPATPGYAAFTPNQATGRAQDPSQQTQPSQSHTGLGFSSFNNWNPPSRQGATPAFMKQLFKTPSSVGRSPATKAVTPGLDRSTPKRLSISLGADLDDSNLSWTSSLATPPGSKSNGKMGTNQSEEDTRIGVMPKALHFTEDVTDTKAHSAIASEAVVVHQGCDTHSDNMMEHDTQPLQLMRLSSAEDDPTSEDTLDSDVHIGEGEKRTDNDDDDDDGDVIMGIPHPNEIEDKSRKGSLRKRVKSKKRDTLSSGRVTSTRSFAKLESRHLGKSPGSKDNLLNDEDEMKVDEEQGISKKILRKKKGDGGHDYQDSDSDDEIVKLKSATKQKRPLPVSDEEDLAPFKDNIEVRKPQNIPSPFSFVEYEIHREDEMEVGRLEDIRVPSDNKEVPSCTVTAAASRTPGQNGDRLGGESERTTSDNAAIDIVKPADNVSSMEETLAFFLATPPQSRARLLSRQSSANADGKVKGKPNRSENMGDFIEDEMTCMKQIAKIHSSLSPLQQNNLNGSLNEELQRSDTLEEGSMELSQPKTVDKTSEIITRHKLSKASKEESEIIKIQNAAVFTIETATSDLPVERTPVQLTKTPVYSTTPRSDSTCKVNAIATPDLNPAADISDIFSQISPNYADALCQAVDAASGGSKGTVGNTTVEYADVDVNQSSTAVSSGNDINKNENVREQGNTDKRPNTSNDIDSKSNQDTLPTEYLIPSEDCPGSTIQSKSTGKIPTSRLANNSTDDATSIFRMQSSTRKFYYPPASESSAVAASSSSSSLSRQIPTSGKTKRTVNHTPILIAGVLEVVKKEDDGVNSNSEMEDVQITTDAHRKSSTPANRSSGFVTFSSFVKSSTNKPSNFRTVNTSPNLPNVSSMCHAFTTSSSITTQATCNKGLPSTAEDQPSSAMPPRNRTRHLQTTPVTGRTRGSLSLRSRRKLGRPLLPPPKRLKTLVETDESTIDMVEVHSVEVPSDSDGKTVCNVPVIQTNRSKDHACVSVGNMKLSLSKCKPHGLPLQGFKSHGNGDRSIAQTSLPKAHSIKTEIHNMNMSEETSISVVGNVPIAKHQDTTWQVSNIDNNTVSSFHARIEKAEDVQKFVGFASASGKAINISAEAMARARKLNSEVDVEFSHPDAVSKLDPKSNEVHFNATILSHKDDVKLQKAPSGQPSHKEIMSSSTSGKNNSKTIATMQHTKTRMNGIDLHGATLSSNTNIPKVVGFSSASGKSIPISNKAIVRAKSLMAAVDHESDLQESTAVDKATSHINENIPKMVGISSASGKSISISNKAMERAKSLMTTVDHETDPQERTTSNKTTSHINENIPKMVGFSFASGKSISISNKAMERAKSLMATVDHESDLQESTAGDKDASSNNKNIPRMVGFSSASGKSISISNKAMERAKSLMAAVDHETDPHERTASNKTTSYDNENIPKMIGFSSASGKSISISNKAMEKAKSLMASVDHESHLQECVAANKTVHKSVNHVTKSLHRNEDKAGSTSCRDKTSFIGFQSASGKNIHISNDAMKRAQMFMNDNELITSSDQLKSSTSIDQSVEECARGVSAKVLVPTTVQFASASGKPLHISDNSLRKARYLMDSINEESIPSTVQFASASGKPLNILDNSMQKARSFMDSINEESIPSTVQFASASGKAIQISNEAIDKAHSMLSSVDSGISCGEEVSPVRQKDIKLSTSLSTIDEATSREQTMLQDMTAVQRCRRSTQGQEVSKPKKDYSKLPKGFRPFKPPARTVKKASKNISAVKETSQRSAYQPTHNEIEKNAMQNSSIKIKNTNKEIVDNNTVHANQEIKVEASAPVTKCNPPLDAEDVFADDGLSLSQAQREIQATEQMELMYAFMQAEDDSYTQDPDKETRGVLSSVKDSHFAKKKVPRVLPDIKLEDNQTRTAPEQIAGMDHGRSCNDIDMLEENQVHLVTKQPGSSHQEDQIQSMKADLLDTSFVDSQESQIETSLNQGFVNSQDTVSSEQAPADIADKENGYEPSYLSSPRKDNDKDKLPVHSPPPMFVGFQTGSGKQVAVSAQALEKAKQLIKAVDEESNLAMDKVEAVPDTNCFETAHGKKVNLCTEYLARARRESDLQDEANQVSSSSSSSRQFKTGFCTAGGNQVNVSNSSLEIAKKLLNEEPDEVQPEAIQKPTVNNDDQSVPSVDGIQADCGIAEGSSTKGKTVATTKNKGFVGFQTASGNKVQVSQESLKKAHDFLQQENETRQNSGNSIPTVSLPRNKGFVGFQTASGNKVQVSQESLKKAHDFLQQENETRQNSGNSNPTVSLPRNKGFVGFQTASGNKVQVSQESLKKAHDFLQQENETRQNSGNSNPTVSLPRNKGFVGFQTASGNKVQVSQESLKKAHDFLQQENETRQNSGNSIPTVSLPRNKGFVGLQTASGNKVEVSDESLKKAHDFLRQDNETCQKSGDSKVKIASPKNMRFAGFQTASGSKVKVSEESLKKAHDFLQQANETQQSSGSSKTKTAKATQNETCQKSGDTKATVASPKNMRFDGLQTASGNKVEVSEESLKKAHDFLQQDENSDSLRITVASPKNKGFVGFQTASGNKVEVSEESLKKAHDFLQQDDLISQNSYKSKTTVATPKNKGFSGFQTAHGNKVEVSEESLKKAHDFLQQDGETCQNNDNSKTTVATPKNTRFAGFQTASGNKVEVSEKSLKKAHDFLQQDDLISQNSYKSKTTVATPKNKGFSGFQTAHGNKVEVSEESLKKAHDFLQQHNETQQQCGNSNAKTATPKNKGFAGFQTASGNKVEVSEESLKKAHDILVTENDIPQDGNSITQRSTLPQKTGFVGFHTAGGDSVQVSDASLNHAKSLLMAAEDSIATHREDLQTPMSATRSSSRNPDASITRSEPGRSSTARSRIGATHSGQMAYSGSTGQGSGTSTNQGDCVVPKLNLPEEAGRAGHKRTAAQAMLPKNDSNAKKQFIPFVRRQHPMTSSPAGNMGDRSNGTSQTSKSFRPYHTTPVTTNSSKSKNHHTHISHTPSGPSSLTAESSSNQSRKPHVQVHTEEVQVVPQRPLQFKQGLKSGAPFYKKSIFQQGQEQRRQQNGRTAAGQRSSGFQRFVSSSNPNQSSNTFVSQSERLSTSCNYPSSSGRESGGSDDMADKGNTVVELVEIWKEARKSQLIRIEAKKTQHIKPHPGSLYTKRRQMQRIKLYDVVQGQPPKTSTKQQLYTHGVLASTLLINAANAESFRFKGQEYFSSSAMATEGGILLGDGGRLVMDDASTAGKQEFYNALMDTTGVVPKLVSPEWVYNHYKWIVWKLAAMEVSYPHQFAARLLTPHRVVEELKYRYDREIDSAQRSALKKILERDEAPSRRLVLCVSAVYKTSGESVVAKADDCEKPNDNKKQKAPVPTIALTDGWYSIRTAIDKPLATRVQNGKLFVGQKLCIYGAELVGSDDACSPLEVPANLMLRIMTNSTRPARYDARLGLQNNPQPFPLSLSSLYGEGGMVGCLDVVVARCYPIQYMEKYSGEGGGAAFRNRRAEDKEAAKYSREKHQRMEKLYSKIQKEFEKKQAKKEPRRKTRSRSSQHRLKESQIQELQTGQEIYEALNETFDPGSIEMHLSERQMTTLQNYQRTLQEKEQAELQMEFKKVLEEQEEEFPERNVTPLLRVRLANYHHQLAPGESGCHQQHTCMMTVWRPTEDIMAYLTEGKRLRIYHVNVSPGRFNKQNGTKSVQLSSNKRTRYNDLTPDAHQLETVYQPRVATSIWQMIHDRSYEAVFGEVDVVGLVVSVNSGSSATRNNSNTSSSLQTVYITDPETNVIAIKFWGGLQGHSVEDIVKPGVFICCTNLQYKSRDRFNSTPCLQASDMSSFTQTPKAANMRQSLHELNAAIKKPQDFIKQIDCNAAIASSSMNHALPSPTVTMNLFESHSRTTTPLVTVKKSSSATAFVNRDQGIQHVHQATVDFVSNSSPRSFHGTHGNSTAKGCSVEEYEHSTTLYKNENINCASKNITFGGSGGGGKDENLPAVRPAAKQFIRYSGAPHTPSSLADHASTSANISKTLPGEPRPGHQTDTVVNGGLFSPGSGPSCSVQKHFTPAAAAKSRRSMYFTPGAGGGGVEAGLGRPPAVLTRSNLFGASGARLITPKPPIGNTTHDISLDSTPESTLPNSQVELQRNDTSRRTRLLGRIPSPPPLSPLPSPLPRVVRRGFRPPNRHGLKSSVSKETSDSSGLGQASEVSHNKRVTNGPQAGMDITPPQCKEVSLTRDDLTSSQREVQDLLQMSPSCLQELDMEWSQQTPDITSCPGTATSHITAVPSSVTMEVRDQVDKPVTSFEPESDSPPMDLDTDSFPRAQELDSQLQHLSSTRDVENGAVGKTSLQQDTETSHPFGVTTNASEATKTINVYKTPMHKLTASGDKLPNVDGGTTTPLVNQKPNSQSSLSLKSKPSKRFCTRADYAVIDFESLEVAADDSTGNRRSTRSSARKSKN